MKSKITAKQKRAEQEEKQAIRDIKKHAGLKPGDTIYSIVRHVSQSGMSRDISFYKVFKGELVCLDWYIEKILGWKRSSNGGIRVGGCGMDMCFHTVYTLGATVWSRGTRKPHGSRNGAPDHSGGYALKSRSM